MKIERILFETELARYNKGILDIFDRHTRKYNIGKNFILNDQLDQQIKEFHPIHFQVIQGLVCFEWGISSIPRNFRWPHVVRNF